MTTNSDENFDFKPGYDFEYNLPQGGMVNNCGPNSLSCYFKYLLISGILEEKWPFQSAGYTKLLQCFKQYYNLTDNDKVTWHTMKKYLKSLSKDEMESNFVPVMRLFAKDALPMNNRWIAGKKQVIRSMLLMYCCKKNYAGHFDLLQQDMIKIPEIQQQFIAVKEKIGNDPNALNNYAKSQEINAATEKILNSFLEALAGSEYQIMFSEKELIACAECLNINTEIYDLDTIYGHSTGARTHNVLGNGCANMKIGLHNAIHWEVQAMNQEHKDIHEELSYNLPLSKDSEREKILSLIEEDNADMLQMPASIKKHAHTEYLSVDVIKKSLLDLGWSEYIANEIAAQQKYGTTILDKHTWLCNNPHIVFVWSKKELIKPIQDNLINNGFIQQFKTTNDVNSRDNKFQQGFVAAYNEFQKNHNITQSAFKIAGQKEKYTIDVWRERDINKKIQLAYANALQQTQDPVLAYEAVVSSLIYIRYHYNLNENIEDHYSQESIFNYDVFTVQYNDDKELDMKEIKKLKHKPLIILHRGAYYVFGDGASTAADDLSLRKVEGDDQEYMSALTYDTSGNIRKVDHNTAIDLRYFLENKNLAHNKNIDKIAGVEEIYMKVFFFLDPQHQQAIGNQSEHYKKMYKYYTSRCGGFMLQRKKKSMQDYQLSDGEMATLDYKRFNLVLNIEAPATANAEDTTLDTLSTDADYQVNMMLVKGPISSEQKQAYKNKYKEILQAMTQAHKPLSLFFLRDNNNWPADLAGTLAAEAVFEFFQSQPFEEDALYNMNLQQSYNTDLHIPLYLCDQDELYREFFSSFGQTINELYDKSLKKNKPIDNKLQDSSFNQQQDVVSEIQQHYQGKNAQVSQSESAAKNGDVQFITHAFSKQNKVTQDINNDVEHNIDASGINIQAPFVEDVVWEKFQQDVAQHKFKQFGNNSKIITKKINANKIKICEKQADQLEIDVAIAHRNHSGVMFDFIIEEIDFFKLHSVISMAIMIAKEKQSTTLDIGGNNVAYILAASGIAKGYGYNINLSDQAANIIQDENKQDILNAMDTQQFRTEFEQCKNLEDISNMQKVFAPFFNSKNNNKYKM